VGVRCAVTAHIGFPLGPGQAHLPPTQGSQADVGNSVVFVRSTLISGTSFTTGKTLVKTYLGLHTCIHVVDPFVMVYCYGRYGNLCHGCHGNLVLVVMVVMVAF